MENKCSNNLINPNWGKHGYIQVYTGDGKGKTTASLGLAMRALGRCWKVLIIMFTKGGDDYGELYSFRNLSPEIAENLTIIQAGLDRIVYADNKSEEDAKAIQKGWEYAKKAIKNDEYNLIILDEANIAIDLGRPIKMNFFLMSMLGAQKTLYIFVIRLRSQKPTLTAV